ncbi:MAG: cryptochrome/photolyase family protein [Pseudomonadota bacterium]
MSDPQPHRGLALLGDQLFPLAALAGLECVPVYLSEDRELCTRVRHHQQKLVLFLAAMREHADRLRSASFAVTYHRLEDTGAESYTERLAEWIRDEGLSELVMFEIEDHFMAHRIEALCAALEIPLTLLPSPGFVTSREAFSDYVQGDKRPHMANFYKRQRRAAGILLEPDGGPRGGQWSFDADNRKKLPAAVTPPPAPTATWTPHVEAVVELVEREFSDHPGAARDFWWPVTRDEALVWLDGFVNERFERYGDYQDAITQRSDTVFHSVLSPLINLGLITPREIVDRALEVADRMNVPMNALEGFIRQVVGWREFIRGIYHHYDERQRTSNFFDHHRSLTRAWYTGDTGIPPLDDAIKSIQRLGWSHHILRLMVVGNLMNLCEIEPVQVHDWFMETHVDSADWVMGPNVYGMALHSDGGIFATKPYICGSNYLIKMSDYSRGEWCDVVDGLYWRFIDRHQDFFTRNPRLSMMVRTLNRIKPERRERLAAAADQFLARHTA